MRRGSLRSQLVWTGAVAAVLPVVALLLVVYEVENESVEASDGTVSVISESGLSPWVPGAAAVLGCGALVVVWFWARRAVDPIVEMTQLADEIQAGSLDRRLELSDAPVEIHELAHSFDRMLDRLAAASSVERRLLEDVSHELRTPLAALSARLEVAARRPDGAGLSEDLAACQADATRLHATLEALLTSARARQSEIGQVDNDVVAIVERVVEHQRLISPEVPISVRVPTEALLGIDGPIVERAVANLVTNAVEHGGGAPITVSVVDSPDAVQVIVIDEGPGIDPKRAASVFDRYAGDGHGLGLALVKQVADAYGGVEINSPVDGHSGTRVSLWFERRRGQA